jgi:hypothetical protein
MVFTCSKGVCGHVCSILLQYQYWEIDNVQYTYVMFTVLEFIVLDLLCFRSDTVSQYLEQTIPETTGSVDPV